MTGLILQFVLLALLIVGAGSLLATSADRIGRLTGMGSTLAGFLLLAVATSLPELVIGCNAAWIGAADLAIGDLLGSSIYNLLILGTIDLIHRSPVRILSFVSAAHALTASTSIVLTGIVLISILLPHEFEILGIGPGAWLIFASYVMSVRLVYFDQRVAQQAASSEAATDLLEGMSFRRSVGVFTLATVVVVFCGPLLTHVAERLAVETGLGGTFVGTAFMALTTSLPEIITTFAAVRMGAFEMAAGNIFGSNCFNMATVPIVDLFYRAGPLLRAVEMTHAVTACAVIIVTGLATMGLLYRVEKRYWLVEPDALLVVLLSIASLVVVMLLNGS